VKLVDRDPKINIIRSCQPFHVFSIRFAVARSVIGSCQTSKGGSRDALQLKAADAEPVVLGYNCEAAALEVLRNRALQIEPSTVRNRSTPQ